MGSFADLHPISKIVLTLAMWIGRLEVWFQGTTWVDGPIWWQVGLGTGLVLLAGFWARRVPTRLTRG